MYIYVYVYTYILHLTQHTYRRGGRVVKAVDLPIHWVFPRGFESHPRRFLELQNNCGVVTLPPTEIHHVKYMCLEISSRRSATSLCSMIRKKTLAGPLTSPNNVCFLATFWFASLSILQSRSFPFSCTEHIFRGSGSNA